MPIIRNNVVIVTNKDGTQRVIASVSELQQWLATLSEDEVKLYNDKYRFEPIRNKTGIKGYTGTLRDL
jgi:hypothetical protein